MRLLLQRVDGARVEANSVLAGEIGQGLLVLAGFGAGDGPDLPGSRLWQTLLDKVLDLRIFPDADGKLNLSLRDTGGGLLLVSQFTLYADARRGRRPSFSDAAPPEAARVLYERLAQDLERAMAGVGPFAQGVFGADMRVAFTNWGPVTLLLDSADFAAR